MRVNAVYITILLAVLSILVNSCESKKNKVGDSTSYTVRVQKGSDVLHEISKSKYPEEKALYNQIMKEEVLLNEWLTKVVVKYPNRTITAIGLNIAGAQHGTIMLNQAILLITANSENRTLTVYNSWDSSVGKPLYQVLFCQGSGTPYFLLLAQHANKPVNNFVLTKFDAHNKRHLLSLNYLGDEGMSYHAQFSLRNFNIDTDLFTNDWAISVTQITNKLSRHRVGSIALTQDGIPRTIVLENEENSGLEICFEEDNSGVPKNVGPDKKNSNKIKESEE